MLFASSCGFEILSRVLHVTLKGTPFSISWRAGLSFSLPGNIFFLLCFWVTLFLEVEFLVDSLFLLVVWMCHPLPLGLYGFYWEGRVSLTEDPLYVTGCFSPAVPSLSFGSLTVVKVSVCSLWVNHVEFVESPRCVPCFSSDLGSFQPLFFPIFFWPLSCSPFLLGLLLCIRWCTWRSSRCWSWN